MHGINIITKGGKGKAAKYYADNKEILREDARNKNRSLTEKENIKEKDAT